MKQNFWTVTTGLAIFVIFLAIHDCEKKETEIAKWRFLAQRWAPTEDDIQDGTDVALEIVTKGNAGGSPTETNQPLEVLDRSGPRPAEEEIKDDTPLVSAAQDIVDSNNYSYIDVNDYRIFTWEAGQQEGRVGRVLDSDGKLFTVLKSAVGYQLDLEDPNFLTGESIHRLCKSGRVCEVMGHRWGTLEHVGKDGSYSRELICDLCCATRPE